VFAENNNAKDDADDHDDVEQYLVTGKLLVFRPEIVFVFFLSHSAKILNFGDFFGAYRLGSGLVVSAIIEPQREKYL
jgi:hypothetical protein